MTGVAIGVPLVVLATALLLAFAGHGLRAAAGGVAPDEGRGMRLGAGYFLGMAAALAAWRLAAAATGSARAGAVLALVALGAAAWAGRADVAALARDLRGGAALGARHLLLGLAIPAYLIALWLQPIGLRLTPFASLGSLHAGRYANLARVVIDDDRVPRVAQNYGQSMLAALPAFVGADAPLWALLWWLACSLVAALAVVRGTLLAFGLGPGAAAWGAFVLAWGHPAIAAGFVLVVDSGWPLAVVGYTDTFLAVGTSLLFLGWARNLAAGGPPGAARAAPAMLALGFAWAMAAPQNLVIAAPLAALLVAAGWRAARPWWPAALGCAAALAIGGAVGVAHGGMLMPAAWGEAHVVPGMMAIEGARGVAVRPELPFYVASGREMAYGPALQARLEGDGANPLWTIEAQAWTALRVAFVPIAGLAAWAALAAAGRLPPGPGGLPQAALARFAARALGIGLVIAFLLEVSELKWELTRFLLPGYLFGTLAAVLAAHHLLPREARARRLVGAALIGAATFGPITHLATFIRGNLGPPAAVDARETFQERLALILGTRELIGRRRPAPADRPGAEPTPPGK